MVVGQTGEQVDLVVIGGGPGGYSAAIRAAQLGRAVVLVERDAVGGICLNHGCIPSKALLAVARLAHQARHAAAMGIDADIRVDLARVQAWKRGVVEKLAGGVRSLLDRWHVRVVRGTARFASERRVAVDSGEDVTFFEFGAAVIATGSRAAPLVAGSGTLTPEQALDAEALPDRVAVIGGDSIASELATAFARLGSAVTLLCPEPVVLGDLRDAELSRAVQGGLRRLGVTLHLSAVIEQAAADAVLFTADDTRHTLRVAAVIDAARRVPNTADLNLRRAGVAVTAAGEICVDAQQRTNVHHIFAVGDVTPGPRLAHRAIMAGRVAAEAAAGLPAAMEPAALPVVAYTEPEVVTVGDNERSARDAGIAVVVARFPFAAAGRALTLGDTNGFLRVVAEAGSMRVLGIQIAGPGATELAGEAALAIEMTATLDDLALTLHPHPTLSEAFVEAADLALARPRHIFRGAGSGQ